MKMVYSVEQDIFIVISQWDIRRQRVSVFCNGLYARYLTKYPDLQIQETSLEAHTRDVVNTFFELTVSNKDLQYLRKLLIN